MGFRTVLIEKASKINLDLNNIVVQSFNEHYWINIDEIDTIIIDDPRCNISLRLLSELCENGINMIFTNSSHMPVGCLNTLFNHSRASKKIFSQINWDNNSKVYLWTEIVRNKILLQIDVLNKIGKTEKINILEKYIEELEKGDITNREGLASRTYFKEIFGENFKRFEPDIINYCINYCYQIIRSKIAQEIVANGYNPSLGIFHRSEYNSYNLSDDFIEVFRPIVDLYVYNILLYNEEEYLTPELKEKMSNILNQIVIFNKSEQKIRNCITLFLQNMFNFLELGDLEKIMFPTLK